MGEDMERELSQKKFRHESDRLVVKGVIHGFLLKRLIQDAIRLREVKRALSLLDELRRSGNLKVIIEQALDKELNTALHLAVQTGSAEMVGVLLKYGANPRLCNFRGDTPYQFFMLPRLSRAAFMCSPFAMTLQPKPPSFEIARSQSPGFLEQSDDVLAAQSAENSNDNKVSAQQVGQTQEQHRTDRASRISRFSRNSQPRRGTFRGTSHGTLRGTFLQDTIRQTLRVTPRDGASFLSEFTTDVDVADVDADLHKVLAAFVEAPAVEPHANSTNRSKTPRAAFQEPECMPEFVVLPPAGPPCCGPC